MKKLITILLLLVMTGQAAEYFFSDYHEMALVKETGDKKEKAGCEENKDEKECAFHPTLSISLVSFESSFHHYKSDSPLSPTLDNLTPPPDGLL